MFNFLVHDFVHRKVQRGSKRLSENEAFPSLAQNGEKKRRTQTTGEKLIEKEKALTGRVS